MSKTSNALLINEAKKRNVFKILQLAFELSECAKNCSEQKNNIMADKTAAALYTNYRAEKDIKIKLKLGKQYSENNLIYENNKCLMKHCNKILGNVIKLFKSIISVISENDPTRKKLDKMADELETLLKNQQLTKKEYKTYVKNITELMFVIKPP